jgi:hypothetical protein
MPAKIPIKLNAKQIFAKEQLPLVLKDVSSKYRSHEIDYEIRSQLVKQSSGIISDMWSHMSEREKAPYYLREAHVGAY